MSYAINGPTLEAEQPALYAKSSAQTQIGPGISRKKIISQPAVRDGKFLRVGRSRFWIRGVTYGTFRPNDPGEPYPPYALLRADLYQMRASGVNTVHLYN